MVEGYLESACGPRNGNGTSGARRRPFLVRERSPPAAIPWRTKKEARTADPRLLPHLQPRDAQLDTPYRHAVSPQIDLFHQGNGELQVLRQRGSWDGG